MGTCSRKAVCGFSQKLNTPSTLLALRQDPGALRAISASAHLLLGQFPLDQPVVMCYWSPPKHPTLGAPTRGDVLPVPETGDFLTPAAPAPHKHNHPLQHTEPILAQLYNLTWDSEGILHPAHTPQRGEQSFCGRAASLPLETAPTPFPSADDAHWGWPEPGTCAGQDTGSGLC